MSRIYLCAGSLLLTAGLVTAQTPAFDVASVRPSSGPLQGEREMMHMMGEKIESNPGSLIMRNVRFSSCVRWAYNLMEYQITGPAWINSQRYDISAKAAGANEDQLRLMLRTLLADRFQLETHKESKVVSVYALVVGKGGHKLHPSEGDGPEDFHQNGRMGMAGKNIPLSRICEMLALPFYQLLHTPVVDDTGLKGKYDFSVDLTPYMEDVMQHRPEPGSAPVMPDLVGIAQAALQEQLGLKLEPKKMEMDLIVVDKAEKVPTDN